MPDLVFNNVNKIYPNKVHAVFDFNLHVKHGEFIVIVGPSGCGKSTLLRMVVGLEKITSGEIILDGEVINHQSPGNRNIAMVFQNYALYQHMTAYNNMGISLKIKHERKNDIHEKVMEASTVLDLFPYLNRLPKQLSGGQCQRVALGRTIVRDPKLFLMDEPLSNLDAKLRTKTRSEIVLLQKKLDATFMYVTHDQIEAMTMADRIVVMNDGYVQQVGTPYEVYHYPQNVFVAGFIGTPPMNIIKVKVDKEYVQYQNQRWKIDERDQKLLKRYDQQELFVGIRPEAISINPIDLKKYHLSLSTWMIDFIDLIGADCHVRMKGDTQTIIMHTSSTYQLNKNTLVSVAIKMDQVHYFDFLTQERLKDDEI